MLTPGDNRNRRTARLGVERLEERDVPAITVLVDYSLDARANGGSGFFQDHPEAKATLNRVAQEMGQRVTASFSAIASSGANSWSALFYDPRTGGQYSVANLRIAANTIVVYAGARAMPGNEAAVGGFGGYSYAGSPAWGNTLANRGWSGFSLWGGSLSFDTTVRWHFGLTTSGLDANELDFYSVATHEMGHILGIGTASQWYRKVQGSNFVGSFAVAAYGRAVPLNGDRAHWADGVLFNGQPVSLDPSLNFGTRLTWSGLDQAALRDIGWAAGSAVSPPAVPPTVPPVSPPPPPAPTLPPVGGPLRLPVLVSGTSDGRVYVYARGSDGNLAYTGQSFTPFAGYTGTIRSAVADFNGDRVADYAFATGSGTAARVRIVNGATGTNLVGPTQVFGGFGGGVFIAAGDVNRDGKAELAISADAGGLPAVKVFQITSGQLVQLASFLPIHSWSTSGIRVAMGDLNRDGADDLIIGSGPGWVPRVRVYDGTSLATGQTDQLVPGFLGFSQKMQFGVNVAAGDVDGDGHDDLIVSTEAGGLSKVRVWSGQVLSADPNADVGTVPVFQEFMANGTTNRDGIRVVARDLDGNGRSELVTSASGGTANWLRVLTVTSNSVDALAAVFPGGNQAVTAGILAADDSSDGDSTFDGFLPPGGPCLCCSTRSRTPYCRRVQ